MKQIKRMCMEYQNSTLKNKVGMLVLVFCFYLAMFWGYMLEETGFLNLKDVRWILLLFLLTPPSAILLNAFYVWLAKFLNNKTAIVENRGLSFRSRAGIFIFFLICWGIILLGVYPGFFVYDATDELNQVLTRIFTTHHPIFHVLYMGGIVQLGYKVFGHYNAGICCLMLLQMFFFSAGFTYMLDKLYRIGCGIRYCILVTVILGIFPVIPMMVLCSSKDTVFSLVMVLWMLETYDWIRSDIKKLSVTWIVWTTLLMLLRNNALYALVVLGVLVVLFVKDYRTGILKGLIAGMVLAAVINGGLVALFHASSSEYQEMLTVPIQQLTRVYHLEPEVFSDEEKTVLFSYLPEEYLDKYEPKLSDGVKIGFQNTVFEENKADFLKLWVKIGARSPVTYLNAWLLTSYGFWYPDATIDVYKGHTVYTFTYEDSSYFGYETEQPGVRQSLIPGIDLLYRMISLENWKEKLPVLYWLFSPGFMFWILILGLGYLGKNYGIKAWLPYSCILMIMATLLLGPTFLPRYVFFLWPCNLFLVGDILVRRCRSH